MLNESLRWVGRGALVELRGFRNHPDFGTPTSREDYAMLAGALGLFTATVLAHNLFGVWMAGFDVGGPEVLWIVMMVGLGLCTYPDLPAHKPEPN